MLSVIKTLEFFQHHFFQMGHRDLLVTQNLSQPTSTTAPFLTRSVCRSGGYVLTRKPVTWVLAATFPGFPRNLGTTVLSHK